MTTVLSTAIALTWHVVRCSGHEIVTHALKPLQARGGVGVGDNNDRIEASPDRTGA